MDQYFITFNLRRFHLRCSRLQQLNPDWCFTVIWLWSTFIECNSLLGQWPFFWRICMLVSVCVSFQSSLSTHKASFPYCLFMLKPPTCSVETHSVGSFHILTPYEYHTLSYTNICQFWPNPMKITKCKALKTLAANDAGLIDK